MRNDIMYLNMQQKARYFALFLGLLLFFLIYLNNRFNWFLLFILTLLANYTHSKGIYLFISIWIIELIYVFLWKKIRPKLVLIKSKLKEKWNKLRGFFPVVYMQEMNLQYKFGYLWLLLITLPLPTIYFGLKKCRDFFVWSMTIVSFVASFFDLRAIMIAQILLCYSLSLQVPTFNKKLKIGFSLYLIAYLSFYIFDSFYGTRKMLFSV